MFSTDTANSAYSLLIRVDPILAPVVRKYGPCRLPTRRGHEFDTLVSSIIGQQLSLAAATAIKERLLILLSARRPVEASHFLSQTVTSLRSAGLSEGKARYVLSLVSSVLTGQLEFGRLRFMSDDEIIVALTEHAGIGRWTAEMFLIFGLGREDVFSASDASLRRAIARLYCNGMAPDHSELAEIPMRWTPYRSIASWYLWRSLE